MKENKNIVLLNTLSVIASFGGAFFQAFVLMKGWNWFLPNAGVFTTINYWTAFGIVGLVSVLLLGTKKIVTVNDKHKDLAAEAIANIADPFVSTMIATIILLIMWLTHFGV